MLDAFLLHCTDDQFEAWQERAAILQYDAGMTREEAELKAVEIVLTTAGKSG